MCAAYHVFGPIFPFFGLRQSDAYIDGSYSAGLYGYERYVDKVETNVRGLGKKVILGAQCKIQFSFLAFLGFFGCVGQQFWSHHSPNRLLPPQTTAPVDLCNHMEGIWAFEFWFNSFF